MRPAHRTDRCVTCWLVEGQMVRCFRTEGHDGRHIARHPTTAGEHAFRDATPDEEVPRGAA